MEKYLQQLLADIRHATQNVQVPWIEKESYEIHEWKSEEEDLQTAPRRSLEEWTGIHQLQLPPAERLDEQQLHQLLAALKRMLEAYNCLVVFQTWVPEVYQYRVIRQQFQQESAFLQWHMNFFKFCDPGQEHHSCALGSHCQCAYFADLFAGFPDDDSDTFAEMDPYEQRMRRKYGDHWELYLPDDDEENELGDRDDWSPEDDWDEEW